MQNENHALNQACAQMESIAQMVAALDVDYGRLEELRELAKTPRFYAGFNMPGFLPDSEPGIFDNADDAKRSIIESIKHAEESAESEELAENLCAFAESVNLESDEFTVRGPDGLAYWVNQDGFMIDEDPAQREELAELESDAGDCEDEDDAQQRIHEDPLSVEYRSGWSTDPHSLEAEEFMVLLCTGGPAVRIVGELGDHGTIHRAWLEYQDWGTPWTHYHDADSATLVAYCEALGVGQF